MTRRLHAQDGIAMPVAIIVLLLAVLLTGALALDASRGSRGSNADRSEKRAVQAADAGLDLARDDAARLKPTASECFTRTSTGAVYKRAATSTETTAKACDPVTVTLADGTSVGYRLSLGAAQRTVTAAGTTSTGIPATRRVASDLSTAAAAIPVFGTYGISSYQDMQITNTNVITGDVRTNGNLDMNSSGQIVGNAWVVGALRMENSSKICGPGNVEYGTTVPYVNPSSSASICGTRTKTASTFTYPEIPASVMPTLADSSTSRLCPMQGTGGTDACTGEVWARGLDGDRVLTIGSNASVTLSGDKPYLLCGIATYGNGRLIIPSGKTIQVFIDSPENCGNKNGSMTFNNDMVIDNKNCTASVKASQTLQFYVLGSVSKTTSVGWNSNTTGCATIFAPNSTVDVTNQVTLFGAVAARKVSTSSSASITTTPGSRSVSFPGEGSTGTANYRECVTETATADGCAVG